jgi:hypothetical protein
MNNLVWSGTDIALRAIYRSVLSSLKDSNMDYMRDYMRSKCKGVTNRFVPSCPTG